jgi:hypothetical protein
MHLRTFARLRELAARQQTRWIELGIVPMETEIRRFKQKFWKQFPKDMRPESLT